MAIKEKKKKYYKSFEALYLDVYKLLYIFAFDRNNRLEDAEEIVSMVWAKIAENPAYYLDMDKKFLKNYLRTMVKNISLNYKTQEERRQQREAKAQDVLYKYPDMYSAKETAILRSDLRYLAKARQVLTTEERTLLVWIFEKKMPTKEAARILNISEGAVRVRQHRILGKLKQEILRLKKEEEEI